eukprot:Skav221085  [mRNA]  locus=scaffold6458:44336:48337:- [translate_table: standard]
MNVGAVLEELGKENSVVAHAVALAVTTLNNLAFGGDPDRVPVAKGKLTSSQRSAVRHIEEAMKSLDESDEVCPNYKESLVALQSARFDYQGEPILIMEELEASKVIAAWPKVGEAAIQDAEKFLSGSLKAKLLDPEKCLRQVHEWPDQPHYSKVRASDEEWVKIVKAAHERGLMVPVTQEQVFRDVKGNPVVNGAGGVRKIKTVNGQQVHLQRFISNLIPSNMYQERLDGDDRLLPYLGQFTLLEQGSDQEWLIDSEDFTSCFNLFRIPPCWHRYMAFGKLVDAEVFGGEPGQMVYPAMNVLPMGWLSSVAVIQAIVRSLVFDQAGVPASTEVAKTKPLPEDDDYTVIYLDSYDELRRLDRGCARALEGVMSDRHSSFLEVCRRLGLPLNEGKRLVASTRGTLQGGELDGRKGRYGLTFEKMAGVISLGGALLGQAQYSEFELRHFVGKSTFGMCFRRPLLSIFQEIFPEIQLLVDDGQHSKSVDSAVLDEIIQVMSMVPLMFTNLRAQLDQEISVTDASPSGGGAAVASTFKPEARTLIDVDLTRCYNCGGVIEEEDRYPLQLPISSQYYRNWQRSYQPARAVPASWELVEALMGAAFHRQQRHFALLLALGFNCLLRTSEMLAITHRHVVFRRNSRAISLVLPGSKTSQGNPQVLLVTDGPLVALARQMVRPASDRLLFPAGAYRFRQLFAECLVDLGFQRDDYAPYCLRRGGATWFFQCSLSYDATIARGRWACVRTARQYIDEGTMQLAHVAWTRAQRRLIKRWQAVCRDERLRQA